MGADTPAAACPAGRMIGRRTKPAPNPTISATSTMVTVLPCVMPAPFRVIVVVRRELLIGFLRIGYVDACPIRRSAPRAPCHDMRGADKTAWNGIVVVGRPDRGERHDIRLDRKSVGWGK